MNDFLNLSLSQEVKRAVEEIGFEQATSVQLQAIPLIMQGRDVIGNSQTGSGKTAAFGLPAVDMIDTSLSPRNVQVLILCPTRELAMQATDELKKFAKYKPAVSVVPVYGGQPIDRQFSALRSGCRIVVGTPGRIMDHMRRKTIKLEDVKMVVLDEADEMLNMGFREDIETILAGIPNEHQTVLFSATMPKPILDITTQYQHEPVLVKIDSPQLTVSTIEQSAFEVARGRKNDALCLLLEYYQPKVSIVFCNTKKMVDELVTVLNSLGYPAQGLHGDMKQTQRTQVMNQFKLGSFGILVATDVAARGIDVNDIDIVFNYDLPADDEYYVHRIGRTGRAGKSGKSFTLIQGAKQYSRLAEIMRYTKCKIERRPLPKLSEIKDKNTIELKQRIKEYVENNDSSKYLPVIDELIESGLDERALLAALFSMSVKKTAVKNDTAGSVSDFDRGGRERTERPVRRREKPFVPKESSGEMETIRISIGRADHVAPGHILAAVAGESGLPGSVMGAIDIERSFTLVEVPKKYKTLIIKSLKNAKIKGRTVTAK
ncbi:MAG: DEAD/DEAH box helicase [Clostridiales bacterium]|nr:DEAD/DEAH box helicase [Clostridiales bacterium]